MYGPENRFGKEEGTGDIAMVVHLWGRRPRLRMVRFRERAARHISSEVLVDTGFLPSRGMACKILCTI